MLNCKLGRGARPGSSEDHNRTLAREAGKPARAGPGEDAGESKALVLDLQSLAVLSKVSDTGDEGWAFKFSSNLESPRFHLNIMHHYGQQ